MGGLGVNAGTKPCRWCGRPLKQSRWWRPKRYCNRWHAVKYRVGNLVGKVLDSI